MSNENNEPPTKAPKFDLGLVVTTAGIAADIVEQEDGRRFLNECLFRHQTGDWGALEAEDLAMNDEAASDEAIDEGGHRVLSAYPVPHELRAEHHPGLRIWVITSNQAWDQTSVVRTTTILWPSEY